MEYRIEVLASFKKEAKRLRKHYASFIDDYENKAERESISLKEIEELLRKNGLKKYRYGDNILSEIFVLSIIIVTLRRK